MLNARCHVSPGNRGSCSARSSQEQAKKDKRTWPGADTPASARRTAACNRAPHPTPPQTPLRRRLPTTQEVTARAPARSPRGGGGGGRRKRRVVVPPPVPTVGLGHGSLRHFRGVSCPGTAAERRRLAARQSRAGREGSGQATGAPARLSPRQQRPQLRTRAGAASPSAGGGGSGGGVERKPRLPAQARRARGRRPRLPPQWPSPKQGARGGLWSRWGEGASAAYVTPRAHTHHTPPRAEAGTGCEVRRPWRPPAPSQNPPSSKHTPCHSDACLWQLAVFIPLRSCPPLFLERTAAGEAAAGSGALLSAFARNSPSVLARFDCLESELIPGDSPASEHTNLSSLVQNLPVTVLPGNCIPLSTFSPKMSTPDSLKYHPCPPAPQLPAFLPKAEPFAANLFEGHGI